MAIIELGIDGSYLSGSNGWSAADGIRELMQNAQDATVEHGGELKVSHEGERLVIENTGAKLSRQALLIGNTSKRDREDLMGQWGEGLKFGVLVLVRAGMKVTIRTGPEVWTPSIGESEKFAGASVLKFDIQGGREDRRRVRVEIEGVSKEFWSEIKDNFLFLYRREVPQVETERGALLTSDKFKGRVYVKGIFVKADPNLQFGYNLFKVELDRDRRVLDSYDMGRETRQIWAAALAQEPDLVENFFSMLSKRSVDTEGFYYSGAQLIPDSALDAMAAKFTTRYGADAVPVKNIEESKDLAHFGKKGVVCPEALYNVLTRRLDTAAQVQEKLAHEVQRTYSWDELDLVEQQNLTRAIGLVNKANTAHLAMVNVVDFSNPDLEGLNSSDGIQVARKHLVFRAKVLEILVHEHAHATTGAADGDKAHVARIESTWAAISEVLAG